MFIILSGNPGDGFVAHGPFKSADAALKWVEEEKLGEWWIMLLSQP